MSKLIYISNFIGSFRKRLKCPEMTMQDLAIILNAMGCSKTKDKKYYYDEIFNMLFGRSNEIIKRYKKLHPEKFGISTEDTPTTIPEYISRNDSKEETKKYIEPDETNMDYVSNQLLKDDEVFYESVSSNVIKFIKKRHK
jgi:hypothetical protein